jgi:hypothetical protein
MAAYDRAIQREQNGQDLILFSKGCYVTTFIEELFVEAEANMILDSRPDNRENGKTLRTALSGAIIRFTHFGKMADDNGITTDMAYAAFIRCMAITCRPCEATIDCIIPILLRNEPLCEAVMSGILIQFKRRKKKGTPAAYDIDEAKVGFFPSTKDERKAAIEAAKNPATKAAMNPASKAASRFYMTWVWELGVQPSPSGLSYTPAEVRKTFNEQKGKSKEAVFPAAGTSTKPASCSKIVIPDPPEKKFHPPSHPRYNVSVYGCSSDVYKVISQSEDERYTLLIQARDFLGEHPRQDPNSLARVRKLKPFWSTGVDCFHWLENDRLQWR